MEGVKTLKSNSVKNSQLIQRSLLKSTCSKDKNTISIKAINKRLMLTESINNKNT